MPYNPYTQQGGIQPIPDPGGTQPSYTLTQNVSMLDQARHWIQQKLGLTPARAAFLALHPEGLAVYGISKLAWEGIKKLGQYAVPTNPYQTMADSRWMGNDPSDPFGYQGVSQGPEGDMADYLSSSVSDRVEANHPEMVARAAQAQQAGPGGFYGGPGGMSSYMMPVAGGGPGIPVIEGPKYTGAPYNPHAFEDYYNNGDQSWWDKYQNYPWQNGGGQPGAPGSNPLDGMPMPVPRDPNVVPHIGQGGGQRGGGGKDSATNPIDGPGYWGGGYGEGPDWSGVFRY